MEKKSELRLFNTMSREKEPFSIPKEPIKFYTCGPTVYDYAHIGNLRTYVFEDLLKRTFFLFGIPVKHVMNLTDVEDKTIKAALEIHKNILMLFMKI